MKYKLTLQDGSVLISDLSKKMAEKEKEEYVRTGVEAEIVIDE